MIVMTVCALSAFARDSDLIAGGADNSEATLVFLFQCPPKRIDTLVLE